MSDPQVTKSAALAQAMLPAVTYGVQQRVGTMGSWFLLALWKLLPFIIQLVIELLAQRWVKQAAESINDVDDTIQHFHFDTAMTETKQTIMVGPPL